MHGAKSLESTSAESLSPMNNDKMYAITIVVMLPSTEKYKYDILCKPKLLLFPVVKDATV